MTIYSKRTPQAQGIRDASSVMKQLQGVHIRSVGTARNYEQALKNVGTALAKRGERLKGLTPERAIEYLNNRATEVAQKTLDMERQAIQKMLQFVEKNLPPEKTLAVIRSKIQTTLESRAYTPEQVNAIASNQTELHALSTRIAYSAGLRAHELITLRPVSEQPASKRLAFPEKFAGREGVKYTVVGKGGLCREVVIPSSFSAQLENRRLEEPTKVVDRGVNYVAYYDLGGGQKWSNSFSGASSRRLGWSTGAHGLRHSYAQERLREVQRLGLSEEYAKEVVSQEMGHFRPEIIESYLR